MRFGSTAKVLATCKLKYRISECRTDGHGQDGGASAYRLCFSWDDERQAMGTAQGVHPIYLWPRSHSQWESHACCQTVAMQLTRTYIHMMAPARSGTSGKLARINPARCGMPYHGCRHICLADLIQAPPQACREATQDHGEGTSVCRVSACVRWASAALHFRFKEDSFNGSVALLLIIVCCDRKDSTWDQQHSALPAGQASENDAWRRSSQA